MTTPSTPSPTSEQADGLLPCPFCGWRAIVADHSTIAWYAECVECACDGPVEESREAAIASWNRRSPPPQEVPAPVTEGAQREAVDPQQIASWLTTGFAHRNIDTSAEEVLDIVENMLPPLYTTPPPPDRVQPERVEDKSVEIACQSLLEHGYTWDERLEIAVEAALKLVAAENGPTIQSLRDQVSSLTTALSVLAPPTDASGGVTEVCPWVSVFDRLPTDSKRYLCVVMDGLDMHGVEIRGWNGSEWLARGGTSNPSQQRIVFWAELPQTWMLIFGQPNEDKVDFYNRAWDQLWPASRVFTHEKAIDLAALEAADRARKPDTRAQAGSAGEPDWKHPQLQGLLSEKARLSIELHIVRDIIEQGAAYEMVGSDPEYWTDLHDSVRALVAAPTDGRSPNDVGYREVTESELLASLTACYAEDECLPLETVATHLHDFLRSINAVIRCPAGAKL